MDPKTLGKKIHAESTNGPSEEDEDRKWIEKGSEAHLALSNEIDLNERWLKEVRNFTDVYAGWPGSTCSATVLSSSDLYLKAEDRPDGYLFPREKSILFDGVEIPVHLIGDTSFPLKPWLMKGYSQEHQLSLEQRRFTYTLTSAHSVVDTAFTQLKGRWRCLLKKTDIDISMMPRVVAACCVLHNICEHQDDCFLPEWNAEIAPPANHLIQPDTEPYDGDAYCTAEVIRDTITYNLLTILDY
eukprot:superscaffoldBa00006085_g21121